MADVTRAESLDALIQEYLAANPDSNLGDTLGEQICSLIVPTIRSIVAYKLGSSVETAQDIDDVCADVVLALFGRLDDLRSQNEEFAGDFSGYVAVSAYNACNTFFRHRFPERERVKNRLRYLMKPARGFDLWQDDHREWLCGPVAWRDTSPGRPTVAPHRWNKDLPSSADRPLDLLAVVFERAGTPIPFDDLIDAATELWEPHIRTETSRLELVSSSHAEAESGGTANIARIWREIIDLPLRQRQSLLLNLRGESGGCAIALFPLTGVASLPQIAAALEIPVEEFATLWNLLPLDDASIAARLGVTRQQVINFRKSARKRLERRMALE